MDRLLIESMMKPIRNLKATAVVAALFASLTSAPAAGVAYVEPVKPYKASKFFQGASPGKVNLSRGVANIPLITWAADGVTVFSNGGLDPDPNSVLAKAVGVPVKLELIDDFDKQVENYIRGHSPFLRGTVGMINLAAEGLRELSPDLAPVVIMQLSWSTGADGFVAKGIGELSDLKGKTIVVQKNGPHADLVQVLLEDAGLKPGEVNIKYVSEITYNEDVAKDGRAHDPASAFRAESSLAGAACIYPDILTLTAGGGTGTGAEDSVKGARPILTTRTASRVIADVYAVRADFFREHREIVHAFVLQQLKTQKYFQDQVANIARKAKADKAKVVQFKKECRPLSQIFLQDEGAVGDFISWMGLDLELAGFSGNREFFANERNPVGFKTSADRIQNYYKATGLVAAVAIPDVAAWDYAKEFGPFLGGAAVVAAPAPKIFKTTQAVRKAAESQTANELFTYTFQFPANTSEIHWTDYRQIFDTLHEKVSRYGGAVVQLRGHADNFFYNFVQMKKKSGAKTYRQRVPGTNQFQEKPLPVVEQVVTSANRLSYDRAFSVKRAYAKYLREAHGLTSGEIDLSRFDVKGMGISDPVNKNPKDAAERSANMRGQMVIFSVEAEIPLEFGLDDLQ